LYEFYPLCPNRVITYLWHISQLLYQTGQFKHEVIDYQLFKKKPLLSLNDFLKKASQFEAVAFSF